MAFHSDSKFWLLNKYLWSCAHWFIFTMWRKFWHWNRSCWLWNLDRRSRFVQIWRLWEWPKRKLFMWHSLNRMALVKRWRRRIRHGFIHILGQRWTIFSRHWWCEQKRHLCYFIQCLIGFTDTRNSSVYSQNRNLLQLDRSRPCIKLQSSKRNRPIWAWPYRSTYKSCRFE